MWDLPGPGLEPVSPALAGGFFTTAPPGKSPNLCFYAHHYLSWRRPVTGIWWAFLCIYKYIHKIFFLSHVWYINYSAHTGHVKMNMKFTETRGWEDYINPKFVTRSWRDCPALSNWAAGFLCSALEKSMHNARGRCVSSSELLKENSPKMCSCGPTMIFPHRKWKVSQS